MRFLIVGAGAVGAVIGVALEHQKHEVAYLVRPGRKKAYPRLLLVDASSGVTRCRERPSVFELGERVQPFEWALACTRGDQLEEAVAAINAHLRPDAKVALLAPCSADTLSRLRAAHPGGPIVTVAPLFSAWSEEPLGPPPKDGVGRLGPTPKDGVGRNVWKWFLPPLVKTMVSGEGDPAAAKAAAELATALTKAGLPARTIPSVHRATASPAATGMALLAGWEVAGWDIEHLSRDRPLRALTADAMAEAARVTGGETDGIGAKLLSFAPASALKLLLAAMPRIVPGNAREMWRHHGPKIRLQTRAILDGVLAAADPSRVARLRELRARLPEVV